MSRFLDSREEIRQARLRSLVYLFQKTDRILSGRQVTCSVVDTGPAPAWTNGVMVSFADSFLGAVDTAEDIVRLSGINYHELGHVMFTPDFSKSNDSLTSLVVGDRAAGRVFNILEDQREESMMVAMWPSTRHYLTAMFVEVILNRKEHDASGHPTTPDHSTTFLLSHGRRYLGSEVRDAIEELFVSKHLVQDFKDVIDRYRVLNLDLPVDRDTATLLIRRFMDLMDQLPTENKKEASGYQHAAAERGDDSKGPKTKEQRGQASEASQGVKDGEDDRDNIDSSKSDGKSSSDQGDHGDGDSDGGDTGESSSWRDDEKGGQGFSPGSNNRQTRRDADHGDERLNKALGSILDEILRDQEVRDDVARQQRGMSKMEMPEPIKNSVRFRHSFNPEVGTVANRMGRKLQQIVEQQDPGWNQRMPSGRLNVRRAMDPDVGIDELFDQWDEGNADASSIEAVVLLDTSSSMSGADTQLSETGWAIKRSFDSINAPCTVYEYNDEACLVYEAKDKAKPGLMPIMRPRGGTEPHQAAAEAARRLVSSKRKKKLFIVMTDGQWGRFYKSQTSAMKTADEYIKDMNSEGVLTVMAGYGVYFQKSSVPSHNCTIVKHITALPDLVTLTNEIVRSLLAQRR